MDTLEVWLLQQCNDDNAPGALAHSSVLDRATDRSFLDIAGARSALAVHGQGFCSIRLHHGLRPSAGRGSKASVGIREARPEEDL